MTIILDLLDEGDFCGLPILILLLYFVGQAMIGSDARLELWGQRIAAAAFLTYAVYGYSERHPRTAYEFIGVVFRALMAAGIVLPISWIVLTVLARVWVVVVAPWERWRASRKRARDERHWDMQRASEEILNRTRNEERRHEEQRQARAAVKRRNARADVTRTFHRLRHQLEGRFSKGALKEYVDKYMRDDVPADEVEQYGRQLVDVLDSLLPAEDAPQPQTVREFAERFEREKQALDESGVDDVLKRMLQIDLEEQFEEKVRRLIQENL